MRKLRKIILALMVVAILATGTVCVASAKTEKYSDGSKWEYGYGASFYTYDYSHYYRPGESTHSAKVTLDNGEYSYALAFGDDFPGSNGWARAEKSNLWNGVTYSRRNYW